MESNQEDMMTLKISLEAMNKLFFSYPKIVDGFQETFFTCKISDETCVGETRIESDKEVILTVISDGVEIKNATKLKKFNVKNILMMYLPSNLDINFSGLEELSIVSTGLVELNGNSIENMINLKNLKIVDNLVPKNDSNTFVNLKKLESIDLSGNKLLTFDPEVIKPLKNLKSLTLRRNMIVKLQPELMDQVVGVKMIDLRDNDCIDEKYPRRMKSEIKRAINGNCKIALENITF